jgi:hypothetical protein
VENDILEIRPLRKEVAPLIDDFYIREQVNLSFGKPHLIKKSLQYFADLNLYHWKNFKPKQRYIRNTESKLIIELAVFFDEAAYHAFMPLLNYDDDKTHYDISVRELCLDYVPSSEFGYFY